MNVKIEIFIEKIEIFLFFFGQIKNSLMIETRIAFLTSL